MAGARSNLSEAPDHRLRYASFATSTSIGSICGGLLSNSGALAISVHYADGVTLRALLRRKPGRGVRELRRRS